MHHFNRRDDQLYAEDVPLSQIAESFGTPSYVYSRATLARHYTIMQSEFEKAGLKAGIFYALKANSNLALLKILADLGAGADIVSQGEMMKAQMAGIPTQKMVFSGVGKSRAELERAIAGDIYQINVESFPELALINEISVDMGKKTNIAFRVNPNVEAGTHAKITTGTKENKFGLPIEDAPALYAHAAGLKGINAIAIAMHIGSQIIDLSAFDKAFAKLNEMISQLLSNSIVLERIDIGGGLGIPYQHKINSLPANPADYVGIIAKNLGGFKLPMMLEPGRVIMGNAGILLSQVLFEKQTDHKRFIIIDAAMNDLMRPAIYGAWHDFEPVATRLTQTSYEAADIVGPICESSDCFATDRPMPKFAAGDYLAIMSAGAYGMAMASNYNLRQMAAEVLVDGDKMALIRPRQTIEDMLGQDRLPDWL